MVGLLCVVGGHGFSDNVCACAIWNEDRVAKLKAHPFGGLEVDEGIDLVSEVGVGVVCTWNAQNIKLEVVPKAIGI